jgi:hypothetical protein
MPLFHCQCGYSPNSCPPFGTLGTFIENDSWEAWAATVAQAIAEFAKASAEGRRRQWLVESGFSEDYPIEGRSDAGVISDIISVTFPQFPWEVYQCHACKRLYLPEAPDSARWVVYALEQSLEKQPWPNPEDIPGTIVIHPKNDTAAPDAATEGGA